MMEQFAKQTPHGTVVLPRYVKGGSIRKYRKLEEADFLFSVLESVASEETLAVVDEMPMPEIVELVQEWMGASVGESSPPSNS